MACYRLVGKEVCAPKGARARDRDNELLDVRSDAYGTLTETCAQAASKSVVGSLVQSKLLSRMCGVELPVRALGGAYGRDRNSGSSK